MDIDAHGKHSADVRRAAEYARGIAENLGKINQGPTFDADRKRMVDEVGVWLSGLNRILGKEAA